MEKQSVVTTGVVAFSNLTAHEVYKGKTTGRYSIVITMDEANASKLRDMGVTVKEYKDTPQRKFASQYHVGIVDAQDNPFTGEIPYGSVVRVLWQNGPAHPEHGVPTYLNKVRVVELAETSASEAPEEF
jgi:hypothetical protein